MTLHLNKLYVCRKPCILSLICLKFWVKLLMQRSSSIILSIYMSVLKLYKDWIKPPFCTKKNSIKIVLDLFLMYMNLVKYCNHGLYYYPFLDNEKLHHNSDCGRELWRFRWYCPITLKTFIVIGRTTYIRCLLSPF